MTKKELLAACPMLADRPDAIEEVFKVIYSLEGTICRNPCAAHGNEGTAEGCFECMVAVAGFPGAVERLNKLRECIIEILAKPWPSHYGHHDPKGTGGANCPACIRQYEIKDALRSAIERKL